MHIVFQYLYKYVANNSCSELSEPDVIKIDTCINLLVPMIASVAKAEECKLCMLFTPIIGKLRHQTVL